MDVLVLIDKLDDLVHQAKAVPLTDQVRIDREEIWEILDQMRATIPEEIKQARWIVKERQEMLGEAKREAERIIQEAREIAQREASQQEIVRLAERQASQILESARQREREVRLGAEDYADQILSTLETEPRQVPVRRAARPRAARTGPHRARPDGHDRGVHRDQRRGSGHVRPALDPSDARRAASSGAAGRDRRASRSAASRTRPSRRSSTPFAVTRLRNGWVFDEKFDVEVHGACHRCLEEAVVDLDIEAQEFHSLDPELAGDEDMTSPYLLVDDVLDTDRMASDAVILAMPVQVLCRIDCAGLCPRCGANLNEGPCNCPPEEPDQRWSKLGELLEPPGA